MKEVVKVQPNASNVMGMPKVAKNKVTVEDIPIRTKKKKWVAKDEALKELMSAVTAGLVVQATKE